ncbi:MAG: DUF1571 domain-containing protein [Planctomycetaceae bacterium]|nr:DUF1571 domain-containing protein [Planctomycetaceae bacterium]
MALGNFRTRSWSLATFASAALAAVVLAQAASAADPAGGLMQRKAARVGAPNTAASPEAGRLTGRPAYQVADRSEAAAAASAAPALGPGAANEHPLMPTLRWAYSGLRDVEMIQDYSATIAKRERIGGKLRNYEYMFVKLRQKPFSVYMCFLGPADLKGQEVIFVQGQNNGNMWAHGVGLQKMIGTVSLKPDGPVAMRNQRYPLTELGILNMTKRLVEVAEKDKNYGECDVKFYPGAKINGRVCTCIEVIHPVPRRNFLFHMAQIFVDKELNLPIRYASFDWPREKGGKPELMEEYTYLNLKLNNGFTDADFDTRNPSYKFR